MTHELTIQEGIALRRQLELDIRALIQAFYERTGWETTGIDVEYVSTARIGDTAHTSVCTNVHVAIAL